MIDVAAWLREASLAGLIVGEGERLAFRHDLIREAVYGHMLPAERRDLHRAAGQALAHTGAPAQQVAEQFARGALPGDLEAVQWLERAADETMLVAPSTAVALLDQAVAFAPPGWPGRAALQARMIEPLTLCGRDRDAEEIANIVLAASPDADIEYATLRGMRAVHAARGDPGGEIAALHRAATAPAAPAGEAQQLRCMAALLSLIGAPDVTAARTVAETTLAQGITDDDAMTQGVAHHTLGVIATLTGFSDVGLDHLAKSVALFDTGPGMAAIYTPPHTGHVLTLLEMDAVDEAVRAADGYRERTEQVGGLSRLAAAHFVAALARFSAGRWDDVLAELEAGQAVMSDIGNFYWANFYSALAAKVAMHRGDVASAQARLIDGMQRFRDGVNRYGADWLFGAQAEFLAATGSTDAALKVAEATWSGTANVRYLWGHRPRGVLLVRLALGAGRDELADSVTAELEEGARRSPAASAAGAALLCRGLVEHDPESGAGSRRPIPPDAAAPRSRRLLRARRRGRSPPPVAATRRSPCSRKPRRSTPTSMLPPMRPGSTPPCASSGCADPDARRHGRSFGWEALTPMEAEVSRLVADGLTNPEIGARLYISRRTVETHLSHVFTKLDLAGRTQLAAELARRAPVS